MARGVGVEIGDQRVRVAYVEHSGKRVRLLSFQERAFQATEQTPWDAAAGEALKAAIAAAKAPRGRVAASLDSGDAILREMSLPFKNEEQIKKTFRFELESLIHNYSIEDLVTDYFKVSETDKGWTILASAVPKKIVERNLQAAQKGGVDPETLDLDVTALFNALAHVGAVDTDDPFLVVYGTARFTKILLVEQRRPRSIRTIRFSFPTAQAAVREQEERKQHREWQTQDLDKPAPIVILSEDDHAKFADLDLEQRTTLIEILAKEISRFLLANAATATPAHILLVGDYEVDEAAQMLEAGTSIPVKPLQLLSRIDHNLPKSDVDEKGLHAPVAVGLALKACGVDALALDFRRGEFSYGKKFETIKTTALVTLELVIVLLAAVAMYFHFEVQRYRQAYQSGSEKEPGMMELHAQIYQDAVDEPIEAPEEAYDRMKRKYDELLQRYGKGDHPLPMSGLEIVNQFFRAAYQFQQNHMRKKLRDQDLFYEIKSTKVTQTTTPGNESIVLEVQGVIRNADYQYALQQELMKTEPFNQQGWEYEVVGGNRPTKDGMTEYTLRLSKGKRK